MKTNSFEIIAMKGRWILSLAFMIAMGAAKAESFYAQQSNDNRSDYTAVISLSIFVLVFAGLLIFKLRQDKKVNKEPTRVYPKGYHVYRHATRLSKQR